MTNFEQLKAEIERRKALYYERYTKKGVGSIEEYRYDECVELLDIINAMPEEKPFPNWRHIDKEKPKQGQDCACVSVTYDGDIKYNNFADGPWYWDAKGHYIDDDDEPGVFVGSNDWGDRETHTCSYWMPWEELFDTLEKPLKENKDNGSESN